MNKKLFIESLIGMVMGVGIMLSANYLIPTDIIYKLFPISNSESIVFFLSVIICPFLAIFLHELGHWVEGLKLLANC